MLNMLKVVLIALLMSAGAASAAPDDMSPQLRAKAPIRFVETR